MLIVQKYGGTSVGNPDRIKNVAARVAKYRAKGDRIVVVVSAMSRVTDSMWPGVIVLPTLATGATDGRYLRAAGIPTYGVQGFFNERDDNRAHGRDERMMVRSFYEGQSFLYELVKALAVTAQNR